MVVLLTDLREFWLFSWISVSGLQQTVLELRKAITFIESILHEDTNNPLYDRYTMEQYLAEKDGIKLTRSRPMTGEEALGELLSGKKTHPYDLLPKPEIGNMEEFFPEMTETEIFEYKGDYVAKHLSMGSWQTMFA